MRTERSGMTELMERLHSVRPLVHLMVAMFLHMSAFFLIQPAITDVTLAAICPGKNECSRAIYLSGFQQVAVGLGTVFLSPVLGGLSDEYGRKPLLMLPYVAIIIPICVLAYSRETNFFYLYFILRSFASMVSDGSIICVALAYVADSVEDRLRASAFGIMMGSVQAGFVAGTMLARWLSIEQVFKVAAVLAGGAALYAKLFLLETNPRKPLLEVLDDPPRQDFRPTLPKLLRSKSTIYDTARTVRSSKVLAQVTLVTFISGLGEAGLTSSLMYFLKATFNFQKDQFAELMLLAGLASVIAQVVLLPLLVHIIGVKKVLCLGLLAGGLQALFYGIAWAPWVPYLAAFIGVLYVFVAPSMGSIVSNTALPEEQGKLQGFVAGAKSVSSIISPIIITPLTAYFLSEDAPFHCPGFSLLCVGASLFAACCLGCFIPRAAPPLSSYKPSHYVQVPTDNQDHPSCSQA